MTLKDRLEQAFALDGEKRILQYLRETELAGCNGDTARWKCLFEKYAHWKKNFLLWEGSTYIYGVNGWNVSMTVCKMNLPKLEQENWTEYLYKMTLLAVISDSYIDYTERDKLIEKGDEYNNLDILGSDYYSELGYAVLTKKQWISELLQLRQKSWKRYQIYKESHPADYNPNYHQEMKENYPKFDSYLDYIQQNVKACEAVRLNDFGNDESVWYFAEEKDCFYVMLMSDSM